MNLLLTACILWLAAAALCLLSGRRSRLAQTLGPVGAVVGAVPALVAAVGVLLAGGEVSLRLPWAISGASLSLGLDPLSALFALPIVLIGALAAMYGRGYLHGHEGRRSLGVPWALFLVLLASMLLVVMARNALLFLFAWEAMSLTSFFLVLFESTEATVRRAGWTYLIATHIGTAFLLVLFAMLGQVSGGSLDFDGFGRIAQTPALAGLAFMLALIGFGTKAGFMPLHVWLPEAHPAAPSHVSAVMSGVMIKTGLYGLIRTLIWLGPPPFWWGGVLIAVGALSGVIGVLFVISQHDLKRMLAYSSVENMGIMGLGLGVGLIGLTAHSPVVAALGLAGALLHVLNHAVFKSLLFFGAGAVLHATGTRQLDRLGGLLKRMPLTGATFFVGSVSISGLPPFNGFASEFLIYLAAFNLLDTSSVPIVLVALTAIVSLALIGGLAAASLTKAFGCIFLGEPRVPLADAPHEAGVCMRTPMLLLAGLCLVLGIGAPVVVSALAPVVHQVGGAAPQNALAHAIRPLRLVTFAVAGLIALVLLLLVWRRVLLAGRPVTASVTWDCGYIAPTARMQYTASSFSDPLNRFFSLLLRTRRKFSPPRGYFPSGASYATETPDMSRERVYEPIFKGVDQALSRVRWIQHGRLNLYILYIAVTLLALLAWKLGKG